VLLIAFAFMLYSVVREFSSDRHVDAIVNGVRLVQWEQSLGLFWETEIQDIFFSSTTAIHIFNAIYTYGHFWLIGAVAVWLFFWHRERYLVIRNAVLISGAVALLIFNLFPVAPPRLMPGSFGAFDTLALFSPVNYENSGFFVNDYAAMPSLHVAWNLLICLGIASVVRNGAVRFACMTMPLVMSVTVIVTGNHYVLDVFAGYLVAAIGLGAALLLRDHGWRIAQALGGSRRMAASA
jgi:hypothetical protein